MNLIYKNLQSSSTRISVNLADFLTFYYKTISKTTCFSVSRYKVSSIENNYVFNFQQ